MYRAVNDGAVLLSMRDEVYYGLNEVGSFIWEQLPPICKTIEELCSAVAKRYPDASLETICTDVRELIEDLLRHGLVRAPGERGGGGKDAAAKIARAASSRLG